MMLTTGSPRVRPMSMTIVARRAQASSGPTVVSAIWRMAMSAEESAPTASVCRPWAYSILAEREMAWPKTPITRRIGMKSANEFHGLWLM